MPSLRRTALTSLMILAFLTTACGGSAPAAPTAPPAAIATTAPPTAAPAPTSAPAASPTTAPAATATLPAPTATAAPKVLNVKGATQPGSTLAGTPVEQIIFGEGYNTQKNLVVGPAFLFPVTIPRVIYALGVANGAQASAFTSTLQLNGEVVPLPLSKFTVPPAQPNQKQLRVYGLAVKAGARFPVGQYRLEMYAAGTEVQHGIFDVKEKKSGQVFFRQGAALLLADFLERPSAQQLANLFTVSQVEVETVPDSADYYAEAEIQSAYQELSLADSLFAPFPDEVQQAVITDNLDEMEAACLEGGGVFDAVSQQCVVEDPVAACQAIDGVYDLATDRCVFIGDLSHVTPAPPAPTSTPTPASTGAAANTPAPTVFLTPTPAGFLLDTATPGFSPLLASDTPAPVNPNATNTPAPANPNATNTPAPANPNATNTPAPANLPTDTPAVPALPTDTPVPPNPPTDTPVTTLLMTDTPAPPPPTATP